MIYEMKLIHKTYLVFKYALVSMTKSVSMTVTAMYDNIEPRFVPSRRSAGTFLYISRLAAHRIGAILIVLLLFCVRSSLTVLD